MDAYPGRVELTFHGVEAWGGWDLVYDESRAAAPIGYLLSVHASFAFFVRKQPGTSKGVNEKADLRVSQAGQLGPGS